MTDADLREVVPWIPPRTVSRFHVAGARAADPVAGIYVDTFITPDDLALAPTRHLVAKVHDGIRAAEREGARVATLGGFSSILLEAAARPPVSTLVLTTGNTLTATLIVSGIERAAREEHEHGFPLSLIQRRKRLSIIHQDKSAATRPAVTTARSSGLGSPRAPEPLVARELQQMAGALGDRKVDEFSVRQFHRVPTGGLEGLEHCVRPGHLVL